jgi:hypothetical protein
MIIKTELKNDLKTMKYTIKTTKPLIIVKFPNPVSVKSFDGIIEI